MNALVLDRVVKSFGALRAADDVSLTIEDREIHAIIGPNGAGKTTLIGLVSGELAASGGRILMQGQDITEWTVPRRAQAGLSRSFQITRLCEGFSAEDNVALAVQAKAGHSFRFLHNARRERKLREPAREALERVGLLDRADRPVGELSHGEKRQLELAIALASEPRLLLLDEPIAGMGHDESQRMIALLAELKGQITIVLVEHDMDAVFSLSDRISVLVGGRIVKTGLPDEVRSDPAVRSAYLGEEA